MNARTHFGCLVAGCAESHDAKGYCHQHYKRWKAYGDPLVVMRAPSGNGWLQRGYRMHSKTPEHRIVAERALGKPLPRGAVVHHVDENRLNNTPTNLVICPSNKYHRLIHQRMDAYAASGHWDWRKCPYCHTYDDPVNMRAEKSGRYVHRECSARSRVAAYAKRKGSNVIHVS